jgi:hypothetical protein
MHQVLVGNNSLKVSHMIPGTASQPSTTGENSRPLSSFLGERGTLFREA